MRACFERLETSRYRNGIEMLENCYNTCITLDGDSVEE